MTHMQARLVLFPGSCEGLKTRPGSALALHSQVQPSVT